MRYYYVRMYGDDTEIERETPIEVIEAMTESAATAGKEKISFIVSDAGWRELHFTVNTPKGALYLRGANARGLINEDQLGRVSKNKAAELIESTLKTPLCARIAHEIRLRGRATVDELLELCRLADMQADIPDADGWMESDEARALLQTVSKKLGVHTEADYELYIESPEELPSNLRDFLGPQALSLLSQLFTESSRIHKLGDQYRVEWIVCGRAPTEWMSLCDLNKYLESIGG